LPRAATPSFSEQQLEAIAGAFGDALTGWRNMSW